MRRGAEQISNGGLRAPGTFDAVPGAARLLTAEDLSERWQVPKSHVYRLSREEKLPTVRLGRYRRFRLAEIEAFEQAGGVTTA